VFIASNVNTLCGKVCSIAARIPHTAETKITVQYLERLLDAFAKLRKASIGSVMAICRSVRPVHLPARKNSAPTERIFMDLDISGFFENLTRKLNFLYNLTRITGTLHEDLYIFMTIPR
jgi:hypothetical protein